MKFKDTSLKILDESPLISIRMYISILSELPVYENYIGFTVHTYTLLSRKFEFPAHNSKQLIQIFYLRE